MDAAPQNTDMELRSSWEKVTVMGSSLEYAKDNPHIVCFGDVARNLCGQQCQYEARLIQTIGGGLRFFNLTKYSAHGDYHSLYIHVDDIEEWVRRSNAHKGA